MGNVVEAQLDRYGSPFTKENEPRQVERLAVLVRQQINLNTPICDAVWQVLRALRAASVKEYFLMQPGHQPLALKDTDRWFTPRSMTSSGILKGFNRTYKFGWFHETGPDWLPHDDDDEWTAGAAGRLLCLHECWLFTAKRVDDLDEDLAGRIAVLKTDADRLFGSSQAAPVKHQLEKLKSPGDKWTKKHRAGLLAQFTALTSGPNETKAYLADAQIAAAWDISESSVKQQRLLAAKEHKAGCTA